jgi:hypothetical protein
MPSFYFDGLNFYETLIAEGHQAILITSKKSLDILNFPVENIYVLERSWAKNLARDSGLIRRIVKEFCPDLIVLEHSSDPRFLASKFFKSNYWLDIHDPVPHDHLSEVNWLRKFVKHLMAKNCDAVLAHSRYSASVLGTDLIWPISPWVKLTDYEVPEIESPSYNAFVTHGRIYPYKNLEWLTENWTEISNATGGAELHIFGKGYKSFSGKGIYHFDEFYSIKRLQQELPKYRASIFPYLQASQSGAVLLSASSLSPSLVSNVGALPEMVPNKDFIFDVNNVQSLLKSIQTIEKDSLQSRNLVKTHLQKYLLDSRRLIHNSIEKSFIQK